MENVIIAPYIQGGKFMKHKKAVIIVIMGIIFTLSPYIINLFIEFYRAFTISNSIRVIGNLFMTVLFFWLVVKHKERLYMKTAEALGLIGYLILIILNVLDIISNSIYNIALIDPVKYAALIDIASRFSRINFLLGIMPAILIIISFVIFLRNLNSVSVQEGVEIL